MDRQKILQAMLRIRQFELRAEAAYQQGLIGGFFHSYIGQEAIQTACYAVFGAAHWWTTTYRCHGLALTLGEQMRTCMAELLGRSTGNALGRGGSMHLYSARMLGGFGIVGGHVPIAAGAAWSMQYRQEKGASIVFMGDGAVAQGVFHETANLAALWQLPLLIVIENNQWGMGTAVERAIAAAPIGAKQAASYGIEAYTVDGMDFEACYATFAKAQAQVLSGQPVIIEAVCERFRGHSISDPGSYRDKVVWERDPITQLAQTLIKNKQLTQAGFEKMEKESQTEAKEALAWAKSQPEPATDTLEKGVYA